MKWNVCELIKCYRQAIIVKAQGECVTQGHKMTLPKYQKIKMGVGK